MSFGGGFVGSTNVGTVRYVGTPTYQEACDAGKRVIGDLLLQLRGGQFRLYQQQLTPFGDLLSLAEGHKCEGGVHSVDELELSVGEVRGLGLAEWRENFGGRVGAEGKPEPGGQIRPAAKLVAVLVGKPGGLRVDLEEEKEKEEEEEEGGVRVRIFCTLMTHLGPETDDGAGPFLGLDLDPTRLDVAPHAHAIYHAIDDHSSPLVQLG